MSEPTPEAPRDKPLDLTGDTNGDDSITLDESGVTETERVEVTVRRAPNYWRFMLVGVSLGIVVALILTFAFPENPDYGRAQVFGFLLLLCGVVGLAAGAVAALIADRMLAKTAHTETVEHSETHPLE